MKPVIIFMFSPRGAAHKSAVFAFEANIKNPNPYKTKLDKNWIQDLII